MRVDDRPSADDEKSGEKTNDEVYAEKFVVGNQAMSGAFKTGFNAKPKSRDARHKLHS